jgi:23S rRNA pseudouridine1911/1915/1917 synthase
VSDSGTAEPPRILRVGPADAGARLDAFLAARLGISRKEARRLLAEGAVAVNGRGVAGGAKGDRLGEAACVAVAEFTPRDALRVPAEPEASLRILARGAGWLAVEKPAGVPVHPLRAGERGTLLGAVAARHPEIHGVGEGGLRSGVVHRLDVDTSGVVLFATTAPVWRELRESFTAHRIDKRYRAIVLGALAGGERVELDLVVARHRPARVRVVDAAAGGRRAVLHWRVLERLGPASLVEVRLETGFLHQIRATFAHLGHPVAGDRAYGPAPEADPTRAARQMLHAARLAWGSECVDCPDPDDFRAVLERLRGARRCG